VAGADGIDVSTVDVGSSAGLDAGGVTGGGPAGGGVGDPGAALTEIVTSPFAVPLAAVRVAVPVLSALTVPAEDTDATAGAEFSQETDAEVIT